MQTLGENGIISNVIVLSKYLLGNTKINRVLLRGDGGDESSLTEDLIRKQSSLFINSLNHNTGYFLTVKAIILLLTRYLSFQFIFCEFLNLLVVVGNIYLTDFFLEGRFLKYETVKILYHMLSLLCVDMAPR